MMRGARENKQRRKKYKMPDGRQQDVEREGAEREKER